MKAAPSQPANSKPPLSFVLLSHHSYAKLSHTVSVQVRGKRIYLCARCTGIGLGILVGLLYVNLLSNIFLDYPVLIAAFTIPAIVDWLLQVFGLRESNNLRRVLTGSLVGQTYLAGLVALFRGWFPLLSDYTLVYAGYAVGLYVLFRTTGVMKDYMSKSWPVS